LADAGRENEAKTPLRCFLSARMAQSKVSSPERPGQGGSGPRRRISATMRETSRAHQAAFVTEEGRGDHAQATGFHRADSGGISSRFPGHGEGVAKIEDFPRPIRVRRGLHHARFNLHVPRIRKASTGDPAAALVHIFLENREHLHVRDYGVLDDLRKAAAESDRESVRSSSGIGEHTWGG